MAETQGKVITCKAAVVWGPKVPLVIQEICVDPPQKMEVRVKILYSSICHTDLGCWNGTNEAERAFPRILGHEAVGIVESVGEGVKDVKEGDYVIPTFNGECGECKVCKREESNLCERYHVDPMKRVMVNDGGTRFSTTINKDGGSSQSQPIYHFLNTSTFTEYTVLDSACVVKIDPNSPLKQMSLLSCGVSTGVGAAWNIANVKEGKSTAVFGLGSVGLAVAEGARARGASRIIGVDANASKFEKGKLMGVTDFINPKDLTKPVHQMIREITGGGVDYSFECTGNVDVLREAFLSTHVGWGSTVLVGIYPTPRTLPLHPMELFDGRRITGSVFGGFKPKSQLPNFAQQCMKGVVKLEPFITNELPFEKINDAFQLLRDGKSLRCILQISKLLKR
ncbi:Alcohol dehydrogenase-like 3 [Arabidopsis thaliana]|jgi:alcohol dehydrogenase|uniref:Alcohol dehydrogenase-like 3 n=4 Tax=Arabidopsis TaxID=3701 RepID=ADHL3_ARATH|nr:GroES-like zinc-binding dehydrogenase family protein [Arabidopsis thaliana]A1L4Y2.1 RecName: Full=Alcohol dehydrogenase-like 3 [Arabidopsis thaliana]KAG7648297.1 Alcohol dehydrogenase N-terminal [Arabidopsis thaliana x Arabidopsis arenosa]KAG7656218.1 Alcohol dehydrogenase N-terminal [Arabidopsis suecica]ABM06039.1 At1g32780 [Arabidopsis thaliana]AEE31528.1 GroES-like zinc-binding dehydrogenase family protein [Arabidopsis thaliana]OAP14354.1 hypothetical protein AXX17_AT1G33520 [Arabidopsi|eukprot:NP_564409.1 GroES-like zinc-binding dehydrogenase family protein [Arabidopsis thaliana]